MEFDIAVAFLTVTFQNACEDAFVFDLIEVTHHLGRDCVYFLMRFREKKALSAGQAKGTNWMWTYKQHRYRNASVPFRTSYQ